MSVPYSNRGLFSDHWLRERLPQRDDYTLTPLGLAKLALWLRALPPMSAAAAWDARETLARVVAPCLALLGYGAGEWLSTRQTLWPHDADLLWRYAATGDATTPTDAPDRSPQTIIGVVAWDANLDARPTPGGAHAARAQPPRAAFPAAAGAVAGRMGHPDQRPALAALCS